MNAPDCVCDGDGIQEIRLLSLGDAECRAAIDKATDLITAAPIPQRYDYYVQDALWVRFVLPDRVLYEDEFYKHVRLHHAGVVPELRRLIERSVACLDPNIRTGRSFAAFALAWLDEPSLPLVARCLQSIDAHHNADFTDEEVQILTARHGWSLPMIDFAIAWLELADSTDGGERPVDNALRAGAAALMGAEDFARRYHGVLAEYQIAAYAKKNFDAEDGWQWGRYFGTHAMDRMWFNYYESFDQYIGYYGPEQTERTRASFQRIVDEASWQELAKRHRLSDWDRTFFITFRRMAEAIGPVPKQEPPVT